MVETNETPPAPAVVLEIGRYALHGAIASGGMATVHLGRMVTAAGVARTVAVKRMHPHLLAEPGFASMFLDEARLAMRIQHPNVVGTFDVISTGSELFLVMDFVLGESLDKLLRKARASGRPPPVSVVCGTLAGVLAGLHAAHEARDEEGQPLGIVHRDVSPQNVLVGVDGMPRVVDFGVAKAAGRLHTTEHGQIKGKLAYMAPEQLTQGALDRRGDVFAAAVVLWEGLAGERLFGADNPGATVANVLDKPIVAPSTLNPDVPVAVDAIVLRGLARHPDQRFASARDMAIALDQACPLATSRAIGEWVEREAGDAVRARAALVAEVESRSSSEVRGVPRSANETSRPPGASASGEGSRLVRTDPDAGTLTTSSVVEAVRASPDRQSRRRLIAVALTLTPLLLVPIVLSRIARTSTNARDGHDDPRQTASRQVEPPPLPSDVPTVAWSSAPALSSSVERVVPIEIGVVPATSKASPATHPAYAHPTAAHKPDCKNPFAVGAGGIRVPRPECF